MGGIRSSPIPHIHGFLLSWEKIGFESEAEERYSVAVPRFICRILFGVYDLSRLYHYTVPNGAIFLSISPNPNLSFLRRLIRLSHSLHKEH